MRYINHQLCKFLFLPAVTHFPLTLSKPLILNNLLVSNQETLTKPFNRSALALQLPYTSCTPVTQPTEISDPISSQGCRCSWEHSRNAVSLTSYRVKGSSCCRWNRQTVRSYRKKLIVGMEHQEQYCCRQPQAGETVLMLQNDTSHPMCMCACMGKRDSA